jgi:hypothetical protein
VQHRLLFAALVAFTVPLITGPMRGQTSQGDSGATAAAQGGSQDSGARGGRGVQGGGTQGVVGGVGGPQDRPAGPVPRRPDGSIVLGSASNADKGVWLPGRGGFTTLVAENQTLPFQPWAQALLQDRIANQLEPHARCKPSGVARQFITPYGVEIVEIPELQRIYIFDIGGPHTYRTIYMDGRAHPRNVLPSAYGHSIGWWEGDTLVVDTIGFDEAFWMDRQGTPHTGELHTLERLTRINSRTIRYEVTVDDPGAYTATWQAGFELRWEDDTELFEFICQQANYADELMVGEMKSVDRSSRIVP